MTETTDSARRSSKLNKAALVLSKKRRPKREVADAQQNAAVQNSNDTEPSSTESVDISEMLTKRYGGISVYAAIMALLAIAIVWTAVLTAEQVQQYHQDYMLLQKMKAEHRKLEIEHQRLIIEQQTFSATPQIASRAITELSMFSPTTQDKLILQPAALPNALPDTMTNIPSNTPSASQTSTPLQRLHGAQKGQGELVADSLATSHASTPLIPSPLPTLATVSTSQTLATQTLATQAMAPQGGGDE